MKTGSKTRSAAIYSACAALLAGGVFFTVGEAPTGQQVQYEALTAIEPELVGGAEEDSRSDRAVGARHRESSRGQVERAIPRVLKAEGGTGVSENSSTTGSDGTTGSDDSSREVDSSPGSSSSGGKGSSSGEKPGKSSTHGKNPNRVYLDGLSAPLKVMSAQNGEIDPPDRGESVWLIDDYAAPSKQSHRNVYLVAHSGYGGKAVGDHLTDTSSKKSKLGKGDIITVRGIDYKVFKQERHSKKHPEKMDSVWANPSEGDKQQLRFITCLQRPGIGKSVDLVVVFAEQV